jgi:hypothetical protein
MKYGYIILRDIPKEEIQLDITVYEIKGGFRGFSEVKPGIHYVSVKDDGQMVDGFWCKVRANDAVIKRYDYQSKSFENYDVKEHFDYKDMAISGAMDHVLIPVMSSNQNMAKLWYDLTTYLKHDFYPMKLNHEEPMIPPTDLTQKELEEWYLTTFKSRFEQAYYETHNSDMYSFFKELQFTFISYMLFSDLEALDRYMHLLQATYNAGERNVTNVPGFFKNLFDVIRPHFESIADEDFTLEKKPLANIGNLLEDMEDSEIAPLIDKAKEIRGYLNRRGIQL